MTGVGGVVGVGTDALGHCGQEAGEQRVRGRVEAEAGCAVGQEVEVLRAPDRAAVHGLDVDEPGFAQALEVQAYGVGVEVEPVGEVVRGERPGGGGDRPVELEARLVAERLEDRQLVHEMAPKIAHSVRWLTVAPIGHIFKTNPGFIGADEPSTARPQRSRRPHPRPRRGAATLAR
jgi:hypothetical protein